MALNTTPSTIPAGKGKTASSGRSGAASRRGLFITLEGGEGAGKSSQIELLRKKLTDEGHDVVVTREPGGTRGAEIIRHVLLSGAAEKLGSEAEAMLFSAARSDHVEEVIRPALEKGKTVLCDRFIDSTRVYQGGEGKVDMDYLYQLEELVCENVWPDMTLILDIDPEIGMKRANSRRTGKEKPDRFEKQQMDDHVRRREAFLEIARREPERCVIIDAKGTQKQVAGRIWRALNPLVGKRGRGRK